MQLHFNRRVLMVVLMSASVFHAAPARSAQEIDLSAKIQAALESPNVDRQRAALVLIPELGLTEADIKKTIINIIKYARQTKDNESKALAIRAYGKLAPSAEDAASALKEFMSSPSPVVRRAASSALIEVATGSIHLFGRPIITASGSMSSVGGAAGSAVALIWVRAWVEATITRETSFVSLGSDAKRLLPLFAQALRDDDDMVKANGAEGVRLFAQVVSETLPDPVTSNTETKIIDPFEAKLKWLMLQPVFDALNEAAPSLVNALSSKRAETRLAAVQSAEAVAQARALGLASRLSQPDDLALYVDKVPPEDGLRSGVGFLLPELAKRFDDPSQAVRLTAIEAFEHQGANARPQLDEIIQASRSRDVFVRWVATRTLGRLLPGSTPTVTDIVVRALAARVEDSDLDVRLAALTALSKGQSASKPATSGILRLAARDDPDQAVLAIRTLSQINADSAQTVPAMAAVLKSDVARTRKTAVMYLGSLGKKSQDALPALRPLLFDPDEEVRRETAKALLTIE